MPQKIRVLINNVAFRLAAPKGFILPSTIKKLAQDFGLWNQNNGDDKLLQLTYDLQLLPIHGDDSPIWKDPLQDDFRFYTTVYLLTDEVFSADDPPA